MGGRTGRSDPVGPRHRVVDEPADRATADHVTGSAAAALDVAERIEARAAEPSVDRLFGGKFSTVNWRHLRQTALLEVGLAEGHRARFTGIAPGVDWDTLAEDIRIVEAMVDDIDRTVNPVLNQERPLPASELPWLGIRNQICSYAVSVLALFNDSFRELARARVLLALEAIPFALLEHEVRVLTERLAKLTVQLQEARRAAELKERRAALSLCITAATLMVPQAGLLVRGSLFVGQGIANWALGAREASDHADGAAGLYLGAVDSVERFGQEVRTVAKVGGGVLTVKGFVTDVEALVATPAALEKLQTRMGLAQEAYQDAVARFERVKPAIELLIEALRQWEGQVAHARTDIVTTRRDRDAMMRRHGYRP